MDNELENIRSKEQENLVPQNNSPSPHPEDFDTWSDDSKQLANIILEACESDYNMNQQIPAEELDIYEKAMRQYDLDEPIRQSKNILDKTLAEIIEFIETYSEGFPACITRHNKQTVKVYDLDWSVDHFKVLNVLKKSVENLNDEFIGWKFGFGFKEKVCSSMEKLSEYLDTTAEKEDADWINFFWNYIDERYAYFEKDSFAKLSSLDKETLWQYLNTFKPLMQAVKPEYSLGPGQIKSPTAN